MAAHVTGHALHETGLNVGDVEFVGDLPTQVFIPGVAHYADDFDIEFGTRVASHADMQPDGAAPGEVLLGEFFIHDAHFGRGRIVPQAEIAAHQHGNTHGVEESRRRVLHVRIDVFALFRGVALDGDRAVPFVVIEHRHDGERGMNHAGQPGYALH